MVQWILWAVALCAASAAALPTGATEKPMVVTRDDGESPSPSPTTQVTPTTAASPPPLKVTEMDVRSEVSMRYARTAVVTHVRNPASQSQEALFRVLIPETAYISGFEMTIDDKTYKAYVKGKEEAKQIYDKAVSQGISAAHVAVKARDSNEFSVSMNIEANKMIKFNLTYEELLFRRSSVYNLDLNLLPGGPVPKLTVVVHIKESQPITTLRVPEVRTGNEIDATDKDPSNAVAVIERSADKREATITFKPDLEEQKRLMKVYAEKSKEAQQSSRRFPYSSAKTTAPEGVLGQFVVQYDVDRPKNGDILVNDGYFVHFFAPEELPPLTKLVVFVLDTSGSMSDRKIVQLREAMQTILSELNPGDYFSIVEFSSGVKVHDLKEADEPASTRPTDYGFYNNWSNENKPVTLLPPFSATKENIEKAKVIVSRLVAVGGTNIGSALDVAINIVRKGVRKPADPSHTGATGATGAIGETGATGETGPTGEPTTSESAHTDVITTSAPVAAATTEDYGDDEEKQELESIIVFLTDGEPTVGETDPKRIISRHSEQNTGPRRATIFCLAFGDDADKAFLRKLALRNDGFMRHIYEAADAALQLQDFYRQISSPLLDDVTFVYPPDQVKESSLTKHRFRTYYAGSEVVVAGRVEPDATELAPRVAAFCGVDDGVGKKRYEVFPKVPVSRAPGQYLPLERLWVSLTIRQLLEQKDASDGALQPDGSDPEKKAKELALKFELVTPLTSLVVVKPNATDAVDAQSVDEPNRPVYGGPLAAHSFSAYPASMVIGHGGSGYSHALYAPSQLFASLPAADYAESADYDYDGGMSSMPARVVYKALHRGNPRPKSKVIGANLAMRPSMSGLPGAPAAAGPAPPLSTPAALRPGQSTPAQPVPDQAQPATSPLQPYYLENYGWTQALLDTNSDALVLQVNGTSVSLKLTKERDAPKAASDAACAHATDGAPGLCVYLSRCDSARNITQQLYADIYCTVDTSNQRFAGVCCPRPSVAAQSSAPVLAPAA